MDINAWLGTGNIYVRVWHIYLNRLLQLGEKYLICRVQINDVRYCANTRWDRNFYMCLFMRQNTTGSTYKDLVEHEATRPCCGFWMNPNVPIDLVYFYRIPTLPFHRYHDPMYWPEHLTCSCTLKMRCWPGQPGLSPPWTRVRKHQVHSRGSRKVLKSREINGNISECWCGWITRNHIWVPLLCIKFKELPWNREWDSSSF